MRANGVEAFTGFGLDELFTEVAHIACGTVPLSPHTPKAVTYHAQSHYCRFMIGHTLL